MSEFYCSQSFPVSPLHIEVLEASMGGREDGQGSEGEEGVVRGGEKGSGGDSGDDGGIIGGERDAGRLGCITPQSVMLANELDFTLPNFWSLFREEQHKTRGSAGQRGQEHSFSGHGDGFGHDDEMQKLLKDVYNHCVEPVLLILRNAFTNIEYKCIPRPPTSGEVLNFLSDNDMEAACQAAERLLEHIQSLTSKQLPSWYNLIELGWAIWIWMPKWDQELNMAEDFSRAEKDFTSQKHTEEQYLRRIDRLPKVRKPLLEVAFKLQKEEKKPKLTLSKKFESLLTSSFNANLSLCKQLLHLYTLGFFDGPDSFSALQRSIKMKGTDLDGKLPSEYKMHQANAKTRWVKDDDKYFLKLILDPPLTVAGLSWSRKGKKDLSVSLSLRDGPRSVYLMGSGQIPGANLVKSLEEVEQQLAMVSELIRGRLVPRTIAKLGKQTASSCLENALGFKLGQLPHQVISGLAKALTKALETPSPASSSSALTSSNVNPYENLPDCLLNYTTVQIQTSGVEDPLSYIVRGTQIRPRGLYPMTVLKGQRSPSPGQPSSRPSPSDESVESQGHPVPFTPTDHQPSGTASAATSSPLPHFVFLGSSEDWTPLMRAVAEAGHLAVALDLPEHGGDTEAPHPPSSLRTSGALSDHSNCDNLPGGSGGMNERVGGSRLGPDGTTAVAAAAAAASAPPPRYYGIEAMADAVAAAIRQQLPGTSCLPSGGGDAGWRRGLVLVGYSMGARVALAVAARHPGLVTTLVLVSADIDVRAGEQG